MGKVNKQKAKFADMKRRISLKDSRLKPKDRMKKKKEKKKKGENLSIRALPQMPASFFFSYNKNLGPPFRILVDTNFINFSIASKLDVFQSFMQCLAAKCIPYITDCVMAELEKLGRRYRVALRIVRDPRFERLPCLHKGTYADDCLVERVTQHKCYMVATNDKDLKRRIRKIPGVPIIYLHNHKYEVERLPEAS
ncbi:rRNA-processing protein FCF1 homolog [Babylonia areolata]|uniref:rRNA-processing protein FCF1 homolog n=1 Tax=Babylonia areolata TaxID=304850 RepID=UPI003FD35B2C